MLMSWRRRYEFRLYVRNAIWIWPAASILIALWSVVLLNRLDRAMAWQINISEETARTILGTVAASTFTLVVLVSSGVVVAVQLASAQLTPRIISMIYRNRYRKLALALFVYTFTFAVAVLIRIEDSVPMLSGYVAAYGFLLNIALFIFFIDGMGKTLRPSSALRLIGLGGRGGDGAGYPFVLEGGSA